MSAQVESQEYQAVPAKVNARSRLYSLLDEGVISAANFLTGLLLGRSCTRQELGAYALGFQGLNAVNTVQTALVTTPMTVLASSRDGDALRNYLGGTTLLQLCVSTVIATVGLAVAAIMMGFHAASTWTGALAGVSVAAFFEQIQEFTRRVLLARFRVGGAFLNDLLCSTLRLSALAFLYWASWGPGKQSLMSSRNAFLCIAAAAAVSSVLGFFQIHTLLAHPWRELRNSLRENWQFGRWSLALAATVAVSNQVYPWLVARVHGSAEVGVLWACQTIVFVVNPVQNGLSNFYSAHAARAYATGGLSALKQASREYAYVSIGLVGAILGVIILFRDPVLHLVYKGRYDGRGSLVAMLALAMILYSLSRPLANALNSIRRPDLLFRSQVFSLVASCLLAWPLVWRFGAMGVAFGNAVGSLIYLTVRAALLKQAIREVPSRTDGPGP